MWPRRLLARHPPVRGWLTVAIACSTGAAALLVLWTLLLAGVVDDVFLEGRDLGEVAPALVVMVVLVATRAMALWGGEQAARRASGHLLGPVRRATARHLFAVGPMGLDETRTGEVASTLGAGVDALDDYVTGFLPALAASAIVPLGVLATIGILDPWTTLVLFFAGPMLILLLAVIGGRTRALTARRLEELGWLSSFYLDMIRGLATLKAFNRSADAADTVGAVSRHYGESTMQVLRTAFQTSLVLEWAAAAATALVAVEVSFRLIGGTLSFGTALAVLVLTPEFFVPLRRLALEYHAGQSGRAALERLATLEALPALVPAPGGDEASDPHGRGRGPIELAGVTFTHPGAARRALDGVDLRIEEGRTLAVVGPSGAGKSTLVGLVMRFAAPDEGTISVGGVDLDRIDPAWWRTQVAWVPQRPTLFAGTVLENVALGRPDADLGAVRAALRVAGAEGFVDALPLGLETPLGEDGLRLSGGQRQRLAIARAALCDTPFVVLDEFTAHLDERTEREVLAAVEALLVDRTALVIAHRPATIALADDVVALDGGRVVEHHR
jgi:thiol reductant ABC exporter CydD subunit